MHPPDITDMEPGPGGTMRPARDGLRAWGWVSYFLHLVVAVAAVLPGAQASVALLLIALAVDFALKGEAADTWQASHFRWRIRSVLWSGLLYVLTWPFFILGLLLFNPAWVLVSVWFLYRIVRGMLAMSQGRGIDER